MADSNTTILSNDDHLSSGNSFDNQIIPFNNPSNTTLTVINTTNTRAARRGQLLTQIADRGRTNFGNEFDHAEHMAHTRDRVDEFHARYDDEEEGDGGSDSNESTMTLTPTKEKKVAERDLKESTEQEDVNMGDGEIEENNEKDSE